MPKLTKEFDKTAYDKQYQKENYYRLNIVLPKELRATIDKAVADAGCSKNQYIKDAILQRLERDGANL